MSDLEINPEEGTSNEQEPTAPDEFEGKSSAEIAAMLQEERTRREASEREQARLNDAYSSLAMTALQANQQANQPKADPLPDRDEDPDAYAEAVLNQRIESEIQKRVGPVAQQYSADRQVLYANAIEANKMRMANDPAFPLWGTAQAEVMKYLGQFSPEQQAAPGAMEEAYYRVVGRLHNTTTAEHARKEQSQLGAAGRSPGSRAPDEYRERESPLTDSEQRFAARAGMDEKAFKTLQGGGKFGIDEWNAMNAKKKGKGAA